MAITGTFAADFTAFSAAVDAADVKLKGFEQDSAKVESSLTRMSNALSGTKMIQDATLMAQAVEHIGGVTKLTETELQRLGTQASEAIDKMQRAGIKEIPANLQNIANAAKDAAGATSTWSGSLSTLQGYLGAFGIQASIAGVISFTKSVFDSASAIHDMGEKIGISAEAVQGFKFAAEQAGSSLDTVGTAITKMNQNLATGDKGTVDALHKAGLEFDNIRNMKPEDAFLAIADGIAAMPDPMDQTQVAMQLFGRSAAELLPAIKEGFRGVADGASKMSNETIAALERAQDAWDALGNKIKIISGEVIAGFMHAGDEITSSGNKFTQFLENLIKFGPGVALSLSSMNNQIRETQDLAKDFTEVTIIPPRTKEEIAAAEAAFRKWQEAMVELNSAGQGWKGTLDTIDGTVVEAIKYYLEAGVSQGALATAYDLTATQVRAVDAAMKDHDATLKEYAATVKSVMAIEQQRVERGEQGVLGLSKTEQQQTQRMLEDQAKASTTLEGLYAKRRDDQMRSSLDAASYQIAKIYEVADANVAAMQKTGATSQQIAEFTKLTYEQADLAASQVEYKADEVLTHVTQSAVASAEKVRQATAQIYSMGGTGKDAGLGMGVDDYGNRYYIQPGQSVPYGSTPGRSMLPSVGGGLAQLPGPTTPLGFRATGGPVEAGSPYIVGERGPELYIPTGPGTIVPNNVITQFKNTFNLTDTASALARRVADELMRSLRSTQQLTLR